MQFNIAPINYTVFQIIYYHTRNDTEVEVIIGGKKMRYRPDEIFGGSYSVLLLSESEIHILVNSIPWILKVFIPLSQKTIIESELQMVKDVVAGLGKIYGLKKSIFILLRGIKA